jgi:DNA-directed RNA polymerase specialized sigma24 family protein
MSSQRPPRLRPLAPGTIADNVAAPTGVDDEELVARLLDALAQLPPAERAAAVTAVGYGEGPVGAAIELNIEPADAEAVTRNAVQLLRAALADVDLNDSAAFGRLQRRHGDRTSGPATPATEH